MKYHREALSAIRFIPESDRISGHFCIEVDYFAATVFLSGGIEREMLPLDLPILDL